MEKPRATEEQIYAIDKAVDGGSFKISAFAGSGKTSTLRMIAEAIPYQKCNYIAYNKAIATESKSKFPSNVTCQTFHSLAFKGTPKSITSKVFGNRWLPAEIAKYFGLRSFSVPLKQQPFKTAEFTPWEQVTVINKSIENFCRTDALEISSIDVFKALPDWMLNSYKADLANHLLNPARALWAILISDSNDYKIPHDVYLKYWSLTSPTIQGDLIMFDEAQDADPIMLNIMSKQSTQIVYVGDRHQAIYGWRGALNAMQSVNLPESKLTKSFRFGPEIAQVANRILKKLLNEQSQLIGNENLNSSVVMKHDPEAFIVRTNATAISTALGLFQNGRKPKVMIDSSGILSQLEDIQKICAGREVSKSSDFFGFTSWIDIHKFVEANPNSDISAIVKLAKKYEIDVLINIIKKFSSINTTADCIVCTAHKSKGLEFNSIYLADDFVWNPNYLTQNKPIMDEVESRLIYVAATRGIHNLDVGGMADFFRHI